MVWRYGEILKSMYGSDSGIATGLPHREGATPSPSSLSEIRQRLDVIEELLRDVISRMDAGEHDTLLKFLAEQIKEHGDMIQRLSSQVSELKTFVIGLEKELARVEKNLSSLRGAEKSNAVLKLIEHRLSEIERLINELSRSTPYGSFKPLDSSGIGIGDAVVGGGVNPGLPLGSRMNIRKPSKRRGDKK